MGSGAAHAPGRDVVVVRSDEGVEGFASGDALPDRELLERLLVGRRPVRDRGRPRDLRDGGLPPRRAIGRSRSPSGTSSDANESQPLWQLLGGTRERILAYASSGELVSVEERAQRCVALRDAGVKAVKLRLHSSDWRLDLPVVEGVREAVGSDMEIMVDANQGWRMPGDLAPRWDVATARAFADELARLGVYWLEEPLDTDDVEGYATLAGRTGVRIAAGEMVRTEAAGARSRRSGAGSTSSSRTSSSPAGSRELAA